MISSFSLPLFSKEIWLSIVSPLPGKAAYAPGINIKFHTIPVIFVFFIGVIQVHQNGVAFPLAFFGRRDLHIVPIEDPQQRIVVLGDRTAAAFKFNLDPLGKELTEVNVFIVGTGSGIETVDLLTLAAAPSGQIQEEALMLHSVK